MRIRSTQLLLLPLLALSALSNAAQASTRQQRDGQSVSQAWFLSDPQNKKTVRYCVEAESQASLVGFYAWQSSQIWGELAKQHGNLENGEPSFAELERGDPTIETGARSNKYPCKGDEDLTIFYGVENARVRAAKPLYDDPVAFAHLESFNKTTGWGRGFLWIGKVKGQEPLNQRFHALLTHELGHIFGNGHVSHTIMDERIASIIEAPYHGEGERLPIPPRHSCQGLQYWTAACRTLAAEDRIWISPILGDAFPKNSPLDLAWKELLGFSIEGKFLATFEDHSGREPGTGKLMLKGGLCFDWHWFQTTGKRIPCIDELKVKFGPRVPLPMGEQKLYRKRIGGREFFRAVSASMRSGFVTTKRGNKQIEVLILENLEERAQLYLVKNGEKIRVF